MSEENTQPTEDEIVDADDIDEVEAEDLEPSEAIDDESLIPSTSSNELDIDAALAAVSQLTLLADDDIEEAETNAITDADYQPVDDEVEANEPEPEPVFEFDRPHEVSMARGQLASVIPAFALIAVGGWLTFTLTTSTTPPSNGLLLSVLLIGIGAVFLAQWLNSGRWSRGNFFIGASILLIGAVQLYISQVTPTMLTSGWALWIVAVGVALFGAGILTLPRLPRLSIMGILVMVTGGVGYLLTSGTIDTTVIGFISNLWFVGVAIIIFMLVAPLVRRRQ